MDILQTQAFALLASGMKDRDAYNVCAALIVSQTVSDNGVWDAFQQYAEDERKAVIAEGKALACSRCGVDYGSVLPCDCDRNPPEEITLEVSKP